MNISALVQLLPTSIRPQPCTEIFCCQAMLRLAWRAHRSLFIGMSVTVGKSTDE